MERIGHCIYCGQTAIIEDSENLLEEDINMQATMKCSCPGALEQKEIEKKKEKAIKNINKLFEKDDELARNIMLTAVEALAYKRITKLSITLGNGKKATLTSKEKTIKVEKTETNKSTLED